MTRSLALAVAALTLMAVACDEETVALSTTSSVVSGPTATASPSTTTQPGDGLTSTTLRGQTVSEFQVVSRISTENGEILHIVIPTGGYTDVDLENFIGDLKESDPELWGAEVFDDPGGPDALLTPSEQRTPDETDLLERHHLVSLVGGDTIRFQGPFSEFGETLIGS